jgi:hypothetical protein
MWIVLSLLCVLLSFLPNMMAPEPAAFYRSAIALVSAVFVFTILAVIIICEAIKPYQQVLLRLVMVLGVCWAGYKAFFHILDDRVLPSLKEKVFLTTFIEGIITPRYERLEVIRPMINEGKVRYNEFGMINVQYPANTFMAMYVMFHEVNRPLPNYINARWPERISDYYVVKAHKQEINGRNVIDDIGNEARIADAKHNPRGQQMIGYYFKGQLYALLIEGKFTQKSTQANVISLDLNGLF